MAKKFRRRRRTLCDCGPRSDAFSPKLLRRPESLQPALSHRVGLLDQCMGAADGAEVAAFDAQHLVVPLALGQTELGEDRWCTRRDGAALVRPKQPCGPVDQFEVGIGFQEQRVCRDRGVQCDQVGAGQRRLRTYNFDASRGTCMHGRLDVVGDTGAD